MPIRILATLLALALTSTVSLTAPAAETTDYIAQIKQQQGKAETGDASAAQDPLVAQTLNRHYPVNADASERLARISDGAQHECHYIRPDDKNEYCMSLHSEKTVATARGKRRYLLFRGDNLDRKLFRSKRSGRIGARTGSVAMARIWCRILGRERTRQFHRQRRNYRRDDPAV